MWVSLPDWMDTKRMLAAAVERRVAYVPGSAFYPDGRGRAQMRLAFCYPTEDRIRAGQAGSRSVAAQTEQWPKTARWRTSVVKP